MEKQSGAWRGLSSPFFFVDTGEGTHMEQREVAEIEYRDTPDDIAKCFNISKQTVYKLAREGRLPFIKVGKRLRFSKAEILRDLKASIPSRSRSRSVAAEED
jgi:excisionase family DNA binding protein